MCVSSCIYNNHSSKKCFTRQMWWVNSLKGRSSSLLFVNPCQFNLRQRNFVALIDSSFNKHCWPFDLYKETLIRQKGFRLFPLKMGQKSRAKAKKTCQFKQKVEALRFHEQEQELKTFSMSSCLVFTWDPWTRKWPLKSVTPNGYRPKYTKKKKWWNSWDWIVCD